MARSAVAASGDSTPLATERMPSARARSTRALTISPSAVLPGSVVMNEESILISLTGSPRSRPSEARPVAKSSRLTGTPIDARQAATDSVLAASLVSARSLTSSSSTSGGSPQEARPRSMAAVPPDGLGQRGAQPAGHFPRDGHLLDRGQQHRELVPAQPGDDIPWPDAVGQPVRDDSEQAVADRMPERVVDRKSTRLN